MLPINIQGKVTDTTGVVLQGAVVKVIGSSVAVNTNQDGEFQIDGVDGSATLVIYYIGHERTEFRISKRNAIQRIVLKRNISELAVVSIVSRLPDITQRAGDR